MGQVIPGYGILAKVLEMKDKWDEDKHIKKLLIRKNIIDVK
ncbi:hypothetical protein [Peribacillus simplex]